LKIVTLTPYLYRPNFRGVLVAPDGPFWGQPGRRPSAIRPWNYFFRRIPIYVITVPESHRQTDMQTTYDGNTALCTKVHRAVKILNRLYSWAN